MSYVSAHFLCHIVIISCQVVILALGYGFLGALLYYDYLSLPDRVSNFCMHHSKELTMVVTLIATALSVITATLLTISMKEALRHRISRPISLVQLSASVALTKGTYILRHEHLRLTILTLFVFGVLKLLTAGWTTLLTPTQFLWPIQMHGSELNITGSNFSKLLSAEFQKQGLTGTYIGNNSFEILDIGGIISGISAAGYPHGLPGTFNFNGAKYNVSTQGIVPTIKDYSGSNAVPNGTRLEFSGGNVTVNTTETSGKHTSVHIPQGFSRNYSMLQQGLTANVSCGAIGSNELQYAWNVTNSSIYINAAASNNSITGLRLWSITASCGPNAPVTQEYVTMVDTSGNDLSGSGFLPSVVCHGLMNLSQTSTSFAILLQGFNKYSFLDASACEVTPLLTTVRANYSLDLISSEVISSTPFLSENTHLLSFVVGLAKFQSFRSQGLMSSTIGDTLYSIYSSTTNTSIDDNIGNQTQVYRELEDYWRGVVEFSATFLRSGFMAEGSFPDGIPDGLQSQVNGTMYILTIGWAQRSATYLLAIFPITIITILIFVCTVYSHLQARRERGGYRTSFDATNTLHLIMASAAGGPILEGFDKNGIINNEGVKVQLEESKDNGVKKLVRVCQTTLA
ncbi:hypothetical protein BDR07DRAFT_1340949 [Suillus spraguei]|nr:hypothetical protein BDR07DRAFT_1340949 [Suillus spraguei]